MHASWPGYRISRLMCLFMLLSPYSKSQDVVSVKSRKRQSRMLLRPTQQ
jgi:hypothetical protein